MTSVDDFDIQSSEGGSGRRMTSENEQMRKLFLGGLRFSTAEDDIREAFKNYGTVVDCTVIRAGGKDQHTDILPPSRGYGFVTFISSAEADAILELSQNTKIIINGKDVDIKKSTFKDGEIVWDDFTVTIPRPEGKGFGIAIGGGIDRPYFDDGDPSIFVSDVLPGGPVVGKLKVNDRVISVNGESMKEVCHEVAVNALIKSGDKVTLCVQRKHIIPPKTVTDPSPATPQQHCIELHKSPAEGYGMTLCWKLYVQGVNKTGVAAKAGVTAGDKIEMINGILAESLSLNQVWKEIEQSQNSMKLEIVRDPDDEIDRARDSDKGDRARYRDKDGTRETLPQRQPNHPPLAIVKREPVNEPEDEESPIKYMKGKNVGLRLVNGNEVGIYVAAIQPGSQAESVGITVGDRVKEIDKADSQKSDSDSRSLPKEDVILLLLTISGEIRLAVANSRSAIPLHRIDARVFEVEKAIPQKFDPSDPLGFGVGSSRGGDENLSQGSNYGPIRDEESYRGDRGRGVVGDSGRKQYEVENFSDVFGFQGSNYGPIRGEDSFRGGRGRDVVEDSGRKQYEVENVSDDFGIQGSNYGPIKGGGSFRGGRGRGRVGDSGRNPNEVKNVSEDYGIQDSKYSPIGGWNYRGGASRKSPNEDEHIGAHYGIEGSNYGPIRGEGSYMGGRERGVVGDRRNPNEVENVREDYGNQDSNYGPIRGWNYRDGNEKEVAGDSGKTPTEDKNISEHYGIQGSNYGPSRGEGSYMGGRERGVVGDSRRNPNEGESVRNIYGTQGSNYGPIRGGENYMGGRGRGVVGDSGRNPNEDKNVSDDYRIQGSNYGSVTQEESYMGGRGRGVVGDSGRNQYEVENVSTDYGLQGSNYGTIRGGGNIRGGRAIGVVGGDSGRSQYEADYGSAAGYNISPSRGGTTY